MLRVGCVPNDLAKGITVPIPKDRTKIINLSFDDFRGITINPIVSKIFECCILSHIEYYLKTDQRQFGFKKETGCSQAIHVVRGVVNHFVNDGSTVTLGCLDLAKAFDKCNHYGLFLKLMNANMPVNLIHLFCNWFRKASIQVRWGTCPV